MCPSPKCAHDYAQLQYTILHRTVLIIFPHSQTNIIAQMLHVIGGKGGGRTAPTNPNLNWSLVGPVVFLHTPIPYPTGNPCPASPACKQIHDFTNSNNLLAQHRITVELCSRSALTWNYTKCNKILLSRILHKQSYPYREVQNKSESDSPIRSSR